jgi:aminopeptidase N
MLQGPHTIWAPAADVAAGRSDYAADIGARVVNHYADYFDVEYSLPKMDMCVHPDFGGAMENWGLG